MAAPRPGETARARRLRQRIDALDRRVVALLNERARLGLAMGEVKTSAGLPVRDEEREREVLLRVAAANEGPLGQADLLAIYRGVMQATRRLEAAARRRAGGRPDAVRGAPADPDPRRA